MLEIIYIMMISQIKLFYRSKPRVIGSIAQPTLFLIALGLGFGPVFEQTGEVNYIQYLTPGIVGMSLLFGSMMNGMAIIWDKEFGFLRETLVAPVPRASLLVGRCLGGAFTSILQGLIVLALSFLVMGYQVTHPIAIPMFFLSGAIFPIENLPSLVAVITNINPMTYGVNLLRDTISMQFSIANILDAGVLLALIAILLTIGSPMFNKIEA